MDFLVARESPSLKSMAGLVEILMGRPMKLGQKLGQDLQILGQDSENFGQNFKVLEQTLDAWGRC